MVFGRPFVKRFALCYQSVVCPVVLSVCNVRALWPNGWTDQDDTWPAGRPRAWPHCVRWEPSSTPTKGHSPHPIFGPYLLRPNGCMDQDATWYGARPEPRRLCVRWRPRSTLPNKGGTAPSPIFGPFLLWSKGWMRQDAAWYGGRSQPRRLCVRWRPSPLPQRRRSPANFWPMSIVANGCMDQDATW